MSHSSSIFLEHHQRETSAPDTSDVDAECPFEVGWVADVASATSNATSTATSTSTSASAATATVRHADNRRLRKSCDRCHQQKLRCVGDKTSLARCTRCQRARVECVFSVRSERQANPNRNNSASASNAGGDSWNNNNNNNAGPVPVPGPNLTQPITPAPTAPTISDSLSEIEKMIDPNLMCLDNLFPSLAAWSWTPTADPSPPPLASYASAAPPAHSAPPPPFHSTGTSDASLMSTAGTFSSSSTTFTESPVGPGDGPGPCDLSGRLANVCQALEATFRKVTKDHISRAIQDYPIGEVFGAFEGFLRVLALDPMAAIRTSRTPPKTAFDEYLQSKQASMAAQCYVLCIKLMVSLSEQMLQSLLATPLHHTPRSPFTNLSHSETTQNANALSNTGHIPEGLRLGDLYTPPTDPFGPALNSSINVLQTGSKLLGKMEQMLGIPAELGVGRMSSVASADRAGLDHHRSPSLPARVVASIWEHEASINSKSSVTYFRRCRAAVLGLAT